MIYNGEPGDIINQYVTFIKVCNDQMKKHGRTKKAVEETIRICIDENVLTDYLKEREVEVMDIMTTLFDEEEVMRRYINNTVKTAVNEALNEAVNEAVNATRKEDAEVMVKKMLAGGKMSYEEIAEYTGLSLAEIEALDTLQTV